MTRKQTIFIFLIILMITACQPNKSELELPTLVVLPSVTPSGIESEDTQIAQAITLPATFTSTALVTKTFTPPPTFTASPTFTPSPTITETVTPSQTPPPTFAPTATPPGDAQVNARVGVNLRPGPGLNFSPPIKLLPEGTWLVLMSRTPDSSWYEVFVDGQAGWVSSDFVTLYPGTDVQGLQVKIIPTPEPRAIVLSTTNNIIAQNNVRIVDPNAINPPTTGGNGVTTGVVTTRVQQIYQTGLQLGNRPRVFSKVGDSITVLQRSFVGFGNGNYDLGPYGHLQATIDHYSISPRGGQSNSWAYDSIAADKGFTSSIVLSPFFSNKDFCQPNESSLACEYRISKPSVAVIMLGSWDMQQGINVNQYHQNMTQIVQITINHGVIPILTTFPTHPSFYPTESEAFNQSLHSIATQFQIPIIDLRTVSQSLPDFGVGIDHYHLSSDGTERVNLNGEQDRYGFTLRNFMTIRVLDELRQNLLTQ